MPLSLREEVYREYQSFFEHAERKRRWSVFDDVPWDKLAAGPRDATLADYVETFCGVEMYLPDYVAEGLNLCRDNFGQTWWIANWGYEESKHSLVMREYLLRSGMRTSQQIEDYERMVFSKRWKMPVGTHRQFAIYGALQELTTFQIYKKQEQVARELGDEVLSTIYVLVGRDEMAHYRFYEKVARLFLEEDPEGTKADIAHVFRTFKMPAYDLIPEFGQRSEEMRKRDSDRGVYLREVWFTFLKQLGLTRHDLPFGKKG